jgi:hypothetical protein
MLDMLHILRCIALAQWEVEVGLQQGRRHHCGRQYWTVGWASCDCGDAVVEQYLVTKGVVALCLTRWCRSFAMTRRVVCGRGLLLTTERWPRQVVCRSSSRVSREQEDGWGCLGMSRRLKPQPQSGSLVPPRTRMAAAFDVGVRRRLGV